ncbi:MAG: hypothetical protein IH840_18375 [Candidatus Heimdallarchaeota archaeon]|nr:hypothetical protein [Candidatus Heimdallarchaeota archaeon]
MGTFEDLGASTSDQLNLSLDLIAATLDLFNELNSKLDKIDPNPTQKTIQNLVLLEIRDSIQLIDDISSTLQTGMAVVSKSAIRIVFERFTRLNLIFYGNNQLKIDYIDYHEKHCEAIGLQTLRNKFSMRNIREKFLQDDEHKANLRFYSAMSDISHGKLPGLNSNISVTDNERSDLFRIIGGLLEWLTLIMCLYFAEHFPIHHPKQVRIASLMYLLQNSNPVKYYDFDESLSEQQNYKKVIGNYTRGSHLSPEDFSKEFGTKFTTEELDLKDDLKVKAVAVTEGTGSQGLVPNKFSNIAADRLFRIDDLFDILQAQSQEEVSDIVDGIEVNPDELTDLFNQDN